ncbi:MAG: hypothetical protein CL610_23755 [Anaerolineaceae bacterium]|nr:hypothetical protein [Anaerolineaceae bacterium]
MTQNYSIDQDLSEAETMVDGLETYLKGSELYTSVGGGFLAFGNQPTMTVGVLLMRLRRLHILEAQLNQQQREKLGSINHRHAQIRDEWRAHYEKKLLREAKSRLDSIRQYFADVNQNREAINIYQPEQFRRTVVQDVLGAMKDMRILSAELDQKVAAVDAQLRVLANERTAFLWDPQLEPAYPEKDYWWLYRKPRTAHV